ncbi:hypothetical protein GF312_02320 [Candidatus Poribacteria bacterium]|nr:hypothetical protein [Candidatus Poribacteria bacterium]
MDFNPAKSGKYIKLCITGEGKISSLYNSVELKRLNKLIKKSSCVREDMISDLKIRISHGIYTPGIDQVADRIISYGLNILFVYEEDCYQSPDDGTT